MGMTYSYDVFDTCLVRACGKSLFVFDILAQEVLGGAATVSEIRDFAQIRMKGEEKARELFINSEKEDVILQEIYSCCDFTSLTDTDNDRIMEAELKAERAVLLPVQALQEEIKQRRKEGGRIMFVSDMYLPSVFVKEVLTKSGFFEEGDKLYISGEVGKSKATGNLYKYIHESEQLPYAKWVHKGDHPVGDYKAPRKLGIKASLVRQDFSYYEKKTMERGFSASKMEALKTASISRAIIASSERNPFVLFSADFVAPIYVPFVYGMMAEAENRKIEKLFFLARDGFILYQIARQFSSYFPSLKLEYIYVSRSSLYLPGLEDISFHSLSAMLAESDKKLEKTLAFFKMDDCLSVFQSYANLEGDELLRQLMADDRFTEILRKKHEAQKTVCMAYFEQTGLTRGRNAIVDTFGSRRCQSAINHILSRNGYSGVEGFYFDVASYRVFGGKYAAANFDEMRAVFTANYYLGPQAIFEQFFSITDQRRTGGYERLNTGEIAPVFEPVEVDQAFAGSVMKTNVDCCTKYARYFSLCQPMDAYTCLNDAMRTYNEFCSAPRKEYLAALEDLYVTDLLEKKKLLSKIDLVKLFFHRKGRYWLNGEIVYNSGCLYGMARRMLLRIANIKQKRQLNRLIS